MKTIYTCPMHSEINSDVPGKCPKCGMTLEPKKQDPEDPEKHKHGQETQNNDNQNHDHHQMRQSSQMSWWEKLKMSMSMTMGMEHGGLAGREMAKLMEEDIRSKFFVSLVLTIPIILYSPIGKNILGLNLPAPIDENLIMLLLTTPVYFYCGWIFLYSSYVALVKQKTLNMAVLIAVGITAAYLFSIVLA